jgi:cobalt-zinc-cadmium efflux system membrane fusion protein
MKTTISLTSLLLLPLILTACPGGGDKHGHGDEHGDEHDDEHGHAHEDRHDQLPRTVALSPEVITQAKIVTAAATKRALKPTVRLPGELVAHPDRQATAAARVEGVMESFSVQPGDAVSRGDLLATVRAPNIQSLRAAEAALRAKAISARANAERLQDLAGKRLASQQESVSADADADALEAEARGARERLRALGLKSQGRAVLFEVRAPRDGVVLTRDVDVGAPVTPASVVATMAATDEVWFLAHVFERDVARVAQGSEASVALNAYPEQRFEGAVEYVSHAVDPGARTLSARIPLTNEDGKLRLGLYGTAHVVTAGATTEPGIAVPNSAVTRIAESPVVFVQHADGHFEVHDVVLGRVDHAFTEIVHGVHDGEQVVSEGAFAVKSVLLRDTFGEDHH